MVRLSSSSPSQEGFFELTLKFRKQPARDLECTPRTRFSDQQRLSSRARVEVSNSQLQPLPQGYPWGTRTAATTNPYEQSPTTGNAFVLAVIGSTMLKYSVGVIRTYDFTIKRGFIAPDGVNKSVILVNGQFPAASFPRACFSVIFCDILTWRTAHHRSQLGTYLAIKNSVRRLLVL